MWRCAGGQLCKQASLAAVSLSDLIDSALEVYGIPSTAVTHISGVHNAAQQASFFAQELHCGSEAKGAVLLIGDAAMQVQASATAVQAGTL